MLRTVFGSLIALLLGLGVVSDALAQRGIAPRAAGRPTPALAAPGATGTHVVVPRAAAPTMQGAAANPLTTTQDVRIVTPGRPATRIIIQERPATGESSGPGPVGPAAKTPREVRVIIEEGAGPGTPPVRQETRIFVRHPHDEVPGDVPIIVILPE